MFDCFSSFVLFFSFGCKAAVFPMRRKTLLETTRHALHRPHRSFSPSTLVRSIVSSALAVQVRLVTRGGLSSRMVRRLDTRAVYLSMNPSRPINCDGRFQSTGLGLAHHNYLFAVDGSNQMESAPWANGPSLARNPGRR